MQRLTATIGAVAGAIACAACTDGGNAPLPPTGATGVLTPQMASALVDPTQPYYQYFSQLGPGLERAAGTSPLFNLIPVTGCPSPSIVDGAIADADMDGMLDDVSLSYACGAFTEAVRGEVTYLDHDPADPYGGYTLTAPDLVLSEVVFEDARAVSTRHPDGSFTGDVAMEIIGVPTDRYGVHVDTRWTPDETDGVPVGRGTVDELVGFVRFIDGRSEIVTIAVTGVDLVYSIGCSGVGPGGGIYESGILRYTDGHDQVVAIVFDQCQVVSATFDGDPL